MFLENIRTLVVVVIGRCVVDGAGLIVVVVGAVVGVATGLIGFVGL